MSRHAHIDRFPLYFQTKNATETQRLTFVTSNESCSDFGNNSAVRAKVVNYIGLSSFHMD